jgi:hypothetical protein
MNAQENNMHELTPILVDAKRLLTALAGIRKCVK